MSRFLKMSRGSRQKQKLIVKGGAERGYNNVSSGDHPVITRVVAGDWGLVVES